jgi:hypothetical protein
MRTSEAARAAMALPWPTKIRPFSPSRSLRSMPGPRGAAPTSSAQLTPSNALLGSSVTITSWSVAKPQSCSSIALPSAMSSGWRAVGLGGVQSAFFGMSSRCRMTFLSGPKTSPDASRASMAYATCPPAPVTATRIGSAMIPSIASAPDEIA